MKTIIALSLLFIANISFGQFGDNQDIGLRYGSNDYNRLQLQYRFNTKGKWTYGLTGNYGYRGRGNHNFFLETGDTTYYASSYTNQRFYYSLSFDVLRNLTFMKHDFYYAGASLGVGGTYQKINNYWVRYSLGEGDPSISYVIGDVIESHHSRIDNNGMFTNTRLYIGADVPILDRLLFNIEVGGIFTMGSMANSSLIFSELGMFASGGFRFRLGKPRSMD